MSAGTATKDGAGLLLAQLGLATLNNGFTGGLVQAGAPKLPARTSAIWPGAGVPTNTAAQAAEVGNFVAIPVSPGDILKSVGVMGGSAAAGTVAEYITAIYAGKTGGALLAQSKSSTPGSHPKEEFYESALEKAVTISAANAPNGYVWAMFADGSAGTQFSVYSLTFTAAGQEILGKFGKTAAPYFSAKGGSALKGTAEATLPALTSVANVPLVALF
jgi:hypothetical protein